ncbi:bifunctional 5,10-methylenetetrahydrofolate dehydrogenase/5,10-methenyltetrahydrofolate cyclohydrolase [Spiroplasma alleghenense]|uniref:Bifunctional protein FolD n=1 Tax=Spiroplasma alleghenense TaxID=216931 RepID=A0A345Z2H8_9MOLU|nr:bifunctional 5,10-methylenetetrahydrofolate dehydrogenase/5,10-methenyltetrahydrofolate cyclohydrolase [Spiroplasma alleghenense]AXK50807.1 methylenetetrahydrofolate dehydrogenase/methylenetetrahydrofolate cyclohydrolase [Spiroplasma alleghenense]
MKLLDGKKLAQKRSAIVKSKLLETKKTRQPKLVVILVGQDEASQVYVKHKKNACERVGIDFELVNFKNSVKPKEVLDKIAALNKDTKVDGILIQLPLPSDWNEEEFLQAVDFSKDVDGFHYINQGKLYQGNETFVPCTPLGIIKLLEEYEIDLKGKNITIVGTSNIVGKPLIGMMINRGATVTACNKNTLDIKLHTKKADILVSATGSKFLITKKMVKKGAVIIDVGIIRDLKNKRLVGDVDFENVKKKVDYITPVPGGVGPMTVQILIENTIKAYNNNKK